MAANEEYLSHADDADLTTGDIDFTWTGWVWLDSKPSGYTAAVTKWDGVNSQNEYALYFSEGDDRFTFLVSSDGTDAANVQVFANSFGSPSTGTWYFIACWHDATANTINIQVNDGTIDTTNTSAGVFSGTAALHFGADNNGATAASFWDGRIDSVSFWKRVLTSGERTQLYNGGAGLDFVVGFDAASNSGYNTADAVYSWSHTCAGNYLTVGVAMLSVGGSSVSGITYNGDAMTLLRAQASGAGAIRTELWGLVNPDQGTHDVEVTLSAALDSAAVATSYTGVHQTSPTEAANSATATNVGAADATVNVTTVADGDWVVDMVATDDAAITVGSGQTSRGNVTGTLGSGAMSTEGPKQTAGSVTMSWTDVAGLKTWSIAGVGLRPIAADAVAGGLSIPVATNSYRQRRVLV